MIQAVLIIVNTLFPLKAHKRGLSVGRIGFLISLLSIVKCMTSYILGATMAFKKTTNNSILKSSLCLSVLYSVIIGSLDYIDKRDVFIYVSITAQVIGGITSSACDTGTYSILSSFEPHDREKYIG